jgi:hypothetical protein
VAGGQAITMCARSRTAYQEFLHCTEHANPEGTICVITDDLSSHDSKSTRAWRECHPRIRHAFIPKGMDDALQHPFLRITNSIPGPISLEWSPEKSSGLMMCDCEG